MQNEPLVSPNYGDVITDLQLQELKQDLNISDEEWDELDVIHKLHHLDIWEHICGGGHPIQ